MIIEDHAIASRPVRAKKNSNNALEINAHKK
jgi:hypothetical protein